MTHKLTLSLKSLTLPIVPDLKREGAGESLSVLEQSVACEVSSLMSFSVPAVVSGVAFSGRMACCIINELMLNSQQGNSADRSPLRTNATERGAV